MNGGDRSVLVSFDDCVIGLKVNQRQNRIFPPASFQQVEKRVICSADVKRNVDCCDQNVSAKRLKRRTLSVQEALLNKNSVRQKLVRFKPFEPNSIDMIRACQIC